MCKTYRLCYQESRNGSRIRVNVKTNIMMNRVRMKYCNKFLPYFFDEKEWEYRVIYTLTRKEERK